MRAWAMIPGDIVLRKVFYSFHPDTFNGLVIQVCVVIFTKFIRPLTASALRRNRGFVKLPRNDQL